MLLLTSRELAMQERCSSYVVCEEPDSIVQLSYMHRCLLVSTQRRTFIHRVCDEQPSVQVGRQERKKWVTGENVMIDDDEHDDDEDRPRIY